ncbi:nucleoside-diphosphate sugar epimerase [Cohaesibacter sp. CAU 1516]|uniref:mitochondrial fission ELM1 family protein n=1 Tax=Cohaesibacter sp. CAU 1516 TaxID=2576038 RepID=UPI0010FD6147|nr:mitochondrial fission ELM1 family protein [Cohaesibacter sp. CAU 1516]TLP48357.1 nucleoside-diphosphate sugar epimerase [Cohaesibacter sp. CAU 1516]
MTSTPDRVIWVLTDGKAGDLNQCLGVAERLNGRIETRTVAPAAPWVWLMPWGPVPPADNPANPASPLHGTPPDIAIASGRRAAAYLRKLKQISPHTVTVFLKDPRTDNVQADLIWVPFHDKRRGKNVLVTLTGPHRITHEALKQAASKGPAALHHLPAPRIALVLGGDTAKEKFGKAAAQRLAHYIAHELPPHMGVMVTPSRRTPDHLLKTIQQALRARPHWIWDGEGDNPYFTMLTLADAIIVTADSHSMLSEVLAAPVPVYIFEPDAYPRKLKSTIDQLIQQPSVQLLVGPLETGTRPTIDSTELIADEILDLLNQS